MSFQLPTAWASKNFSIPIAQASWTIPECLWPPNELL
jgi:hypothetical protein